MGLSCVRQALRIRMVEEFVAEKYSTDIFQSPIHLSNGQELVSAAVCSRLNKSDFVLGTYRSHALYLAVGGSLRGFFAELMGKETGSGRGRAGSMHLSDVNQGFLGSSAIVGSTIPVAAGVALACQLDDTNQVTASFFGEGATALGVFHETLNFVSLHNLSVIFICENNGWEISNPSAELHSYDICDFAKQYGIRTAQVKDGNDAEAILHATEQAVRHAREGCGPSLLEIFTHREREHVGPGFSVSLDRPHGAFKAPDPVEVLRRDVDLVREIEREIQEAFNHAVKDPFPDASSLMRDVY